MRFRRPTSYRRLETLRAVRIAHMAVERGVTIAIREVPGAKARKLTKVISYGDGSFGVLMPYHSAHSGIIGKVPVDRSVFGDWAVPYDSMILFSSANSVKLSYHPDGFVQFSGQINGKVISGRDPVTREPKGVGLIASPLSDPIRTGASVGIVAWGLEDFDELDEPEEGALMFEKDEAYFRRCTPRTAEGWMLQLWVFSAKHWSGVRRSPRGGCSLQMAFGNFEASYSVLELKVIELYDVEVVLAAYVCRLPHAPSSEVHRSGWILNGPCQLDPATWKGHGLIAVYPPPPSMDRSALPSLDRSPT
jgi:hypothetical protein